MFQRGRGKTGVIGSVGEVSEQLSVGAMGKLLDAGGILRHPTNSAPSSSAPVPECVQHAQHSSIELRM